MGDANILGRTARIFDNINFRVAQPGSNGDFQPPNYTKVFFPYSSDPTALPQGGDYNFALRLRGYFNVPSTLAGKVIDFGLNCDDFCSLTIGTTPVIQVADERISARVIRQVLFRDAGLYPVELVYYQNASTGYFEWSRSSTEVAECPSDICGTSLTDSSYDLAFSPISREEMYSAIVGTSGSCQECGSPAMTACPTGTSCINGLCQAPRCLVDNQCPLGQICDTKAWQCVSPPPCATVSDCLVGQECDPYTHLCHYPFSPVTAQGSGSCPSGPSNASTPIECPRLQATACRVSGWTEATPEQRPLTLASWLFLLGLRAIGRRQRTRHRKWAPGT
jgi:hypothetical protein